jgi:hypothetical protein
MTIDERLEKLAERTDAIAQSVELLTSLHVDSERRYEERFAKTEERMAQLMDSMNRLVDTMDRLANVVARREEPLDDLDDRRN